MAPANRTALPSHFQRVVYSSDASRIVGRNHHHHRVCGHHLRILRVTGLYCLLHVLLVRRNKQVTRGTVCKLLHQIRRTTIDVLQGLRWSQISGQFRQSSLTTRVEAAPNTVNFTDSAVVLLPGDDVVEPELELPLQAAAVIMIAAPNATTVASKRTGFIDIPSIGSEIQAPDHRASLSSCFLLERMGSHAGL